MNNPYDIVISRHRTEKAGMIENLHAATSNASLTACTTPKFIFVVNSKATKPMIKEALEQIYSDAKILAVNTMRVKRKPKRRTRHGRGMASSFKKAIVTFASGTTLTD
jgi:large subunit ribosomal protein L23